VKDLSYHIRNAIEESNAVLTKLEEKRKELIYEQVQLQDEIEAQKKKE